MRNFKYDPAELSIPWVESPFFDSYSRLAITGNSDYSTMAYQFNRDGYILVDLGLDSDTINSLKNEIAYLAENPDELQAEEYHYSKGKRIFGAWKESPWLKALSLNAKVLDILFMLYQRDPIPFQTITFNYGSNQPLHSDTIHFSSVPERWLAACWVALEDMDFDNGTLVYVPGSHKWPIYNFQDLNLEVSEFGEQFDNYRQYEEFIAELVVAQQAQIQHAHVKAGTAFIWAANLLHGGAEIRNPNSTRYSHVTHYYFEGCDKYYSPMFSDAKMGKFAEKDLKVIQ